MTHIKYNKLMKLKIRFRIVNVAMDKMIVETHKLLMSKIAEILLALNTNLDAIADIV